MNGKKQMLYQSTKRNDQQILSDYRPLSLLPVCSKIFERLIYNSPNESGFRTGDSRINQLLPITYDIFHCFDEGMKTRATFLDISKAFDKVWHKGLIDKLGQYGFFWELIGSINQFSKQQKTKSSFKWPTFILGRN